MAVNDRPARPLRRGFGLLACGIAAADLLLATAVEGNTFGIPTVPDTSRPLMVAYGGLLLVVGLWAVATSFGHTAAPERKVSPARRRQLEERRVVQALRQLGWYVADEVSLANVDVDHVAVGPAGVLAVQTRWTDKEDSRGKPAARARIAATQLRKALAARELPVEVVPAVLTFGPGLTKEPGGVKVVDAVAMLNGYQSAEWLEQLGSRTLLPDDVVAAVRETIADLREGIAERDLASTGRTGDPVDREPALTR
jgi:hypothetical protein